ncbi:MAG: 23S rRNA (uracil(1939)-C(5))-methyltransferase RlmD [Capnocytophaga sp.]|nr:23S rRNA (uracil(1939)-C(5))-methyltransferase RlmD [Capnocytophaga sp.]
MGKKNKNIVFEKIEVIDAGAKGKGVAKAPDGRVIFLSDAIPGDIVDVQTTKKRTAYYEGFVTKFHKQSDKRVTPICSHFGYCGGCKWQNMSYPNQLYYKQKEVENNLKRLGRIELPPSYAILGSEDTFFYRNKMEFSFSDTRWLTPEEINNATEIDNRNGLGFHISGAWDKILDIETCYLQEDPSNEIRLAIKQFALDNGMEFYSPRNQTGFLRSMMIRISSTGEIMLVIQFFKENKSQRELLLDFIATKFPQITSLQYIINGKPNDSIYDQEIICYKGSDCIYEEMEGLRFKINAKSFYQTNSKQAYELYKVVRDFAGLTGNELVYDLYTGTGTIAQFVAQKAQKVVGVEAVPEAINDARNNALYNKINNVTFYVGDMKNVFNQEFIKQNGMPDLIITDPPRDGMHKDVVQQILNIAPPKVVYVSCNSATQARDLALMDAMYKVTKVQPVDMFPQTHHVENVVLLERR